MLRVISRFPEQIISKVSVELNGRDFFPPPSLLQASVQGEGGDKRRGWEEEEKWKKLEERGAEVIPGASALEWTGIWNPP